MPCVNCQSSIHKPTNLRPFEFNGIVFEYRKCRSCEWCFLEPVPDEKALGLLYQRDSYHDKFYFSGFDNPSATRALDVSADILNPGSSILDFGCGDGSFLSGAKARGFDVCGVEYTKDLASELSQLHSCKVWQVEEFLNDRTQGNFDAIRIADVFEHFTKPVSQFLDVIRFLKRGGYLLFEGPIENNISPVFLSITLAGLIRKLLKKTLPGMGLPYHIIRLTEIQQLNFFRKNLDDFDVMYWEVYDTGWPYLKGSPIRRAIGRLAITVSGKRFLGRSLGNRVFAVLKVNKV